MKKYIFFDFDGTIMDSVSAYLPVWTKVIQKFNTSASSDDIERYWHEINGLAYDKFVITLLTKFGILDKSDEVIKLREEIFSKYDAKDYPIFAGTAQLLENLKAKGKYIAILSNGPKDLNDRILISHDIYKYFNKTISCLDLGFAKPNPKLLLDLIDELHADKSEVIYLGDTRTDLEFAVNAGIDYLIIDHDLHNGKFFENILNLL